jgi:hypothetical protein
MSTSIISSSSAVPMSPSMATELEQWLSERKRGIGGSEAAAIFNEGWGCHRRLVYDKRDVVPDYLRSEKEERILQRGTDLEDIVAQKFQRDIRIRLGYDPDDAASGPRVRRQAAKVSKTHPHARVNIDRQIIAITKDELLALTVDRETGVSYFADYFDGDPGPGYLECKTINEYALKALLEDGLGKHPDYIIQMQHGLGVSGYRWGIFAFIEPTWYNASVRDCPLPLWFPMKRNEPLIAEDLRRVEDTWTLVETPYSPLPAPLPDGDKRCKSCLWRKSCRGEAYLMAQAGLKGEDASSDYIALSDPKLVEVAAIYRERREASEIAAADLDIAKQQLQDELRNRVSDAKNVLVQISEVGMKFNWKQRAGSMRWDGKAIEGEINALEKAGHSEIAERLRNCKKASAPSQPFNVYEL